MDLSRQDLLGIMLYLLQDYFEYRLCTNTQDVRVRLLPAKMMYRHYLERTKLDIRTLSL